MDYVEMIKDYELVLGFQELINDSDPTVVKRTIKVFTNSYYHSLRLLGSGEITDEEFIKSWMSVKNVVDSMLSKVKKCENEGILVQLLRFAEAAVIAHLMFDLSAFPSVFQRGREVVKTSLRILKDIVTTPYVGGMAFIFAVRSLISIACLRPDLWEPVTDLLKKQLSTLPPTLFDHNVRSLHKTLQRNLFRLLRRADTPQLKSKLIEMMVGVGVPRKMVVPWAPLSGMESKKRNLDSGVDNKSNDRVGTPPEKIPRLAESSSTSTSPSDPRIKSHNSQFATNINKEADDQKASIDAKLQSNKQLGSSDVSNSKDSGLTSLNRDPRLSSKNKDPRKSPNHNETKTTSSHETTPPLSPKSGNDREPSKSPKRNDDPPKSPAQTKDTLISQVSKVEPSSPKQLVNDKCEKVSTSDSKPPALSSSHNLSFLTSLIPSSSPEYSLKTTENSKLLSDIHQSLDLERVCFLVMKHADFLPNEEPTDFAKSFETHGRVVKDIGVMKTRLSKILHDYFVEKNIKSLSDFSFANSQERTSEITNTEINKPVKSQTSFKETTEPIKSQTSSASDTDMRVVFSQSTFNKSDVDMRVLGPGVDLDHRVSKDPRIRNRQNSTEANASVVTRPEMHMESRRDVDHRVGQLKDPRLANVNRVEKKSRWDPVSETDSKNNPCQFGSPPLFSSSDSSTSNLPQGRLSDPRLQNVPKQEGLLPLPPYLRNRDPRMRPQSASNNTSNPAFIPNQHNLINSNNATLPRAPLVPFMGMMPSMMNGIGFNPWQAGPGNQPVNPAMMAPRLPPQRHNLFYPLMKM